MAITASVAKNIAWRSRGITWVETGSGVSPSFAATYSSTRGSTEAKVPDRPADRRHRHLGARRHQPRAVAGELGIVAGELQPERRRLGMDAVAAADRQRVLVLERARLQRRQHRVQVRQQQVRGLGELHRQAGVQHVRAGHAQMHEAAVLADRLGQPGEEGDHVMARLALDRVDPVDVGLADRGDLGAALLADAFARALPGSCRSAPCPRRPAPRSRTRCDSGWRAPRWPPSRVWCNGEPSLPCPVLVGGQLDRRTGG